MKTKLPNLTKSQRHRLFLLARLLDRVPKKHFDMTTMMRKGASSDAEAQDALRKHKCGTAACALGWGMTSPAIRGGAGSASELSYHLCKPNSGEVYNGIFEERRKVGPRRVAADIRRYLKSGVLP